MPRSGGEYHFLREIYHPAVGFVAGWISATVGFAAPVAIAAIPFGTYLAGVFPGLNPLLLSLGVVWVATLVSALGFAPGKRISEHVDASESGADPGHHRGRDSMSPGPSRSRFSRCTADGALIVSTPFAISLYWVMYAYSGWNASTYIVGEVRNPARTIPLSLGLGHPARDRALSRHQRRFSAHHADRGDGRETGGRVDRRRAHFWPGGRESDGGLHRARAGLGGQRDDVDRAARDGRDGGRPGRVVLAGAAERARDSGARDAACSSRS